ncbi:hypothetical protein HOJ01_02425 [bacterium]|jgi:hypothetical protein|nr:hypothetical protein [bacterium]MBT6293640.1 hypothetical protein [bacterium]
MKNTLLTAGMLIGSLTQQGCGSMAKSSDSRPQISNQRVLQNLDTELKKTCEVNSVTNYHLLNKRPDPRYIQKRRYLIQDIAQINIPIQNINNCVRNIIRGVEIKGAKVENGQIEFTLGENSELNTDLISIYADLENQNLSEHIECTTADFSGFFVRGIVCNHFNLNPLEKAQTSNLFQSNGFNVNLTEKQIIATKK